ncbi:MAG: T9SS type A sorting domain-containing protein [Gemmatimonadetes bacterium]|nr:T9SS type A sorting domain-containing protein [Gemmatimonadota bacterium]MYB70184.1 T9SS type A sorting domain-containing protein [Gemmatimonadota bacterium]
MRCLLIVIGLLAAPLGAFALTWDFDDGTTWGWAAREGILGKYGGKHTSVYSEVEDGVWRIAPVSNAQYPAILLNSPPIGEDSALFDRVTLRLRIIHHSPTEGKIQMRWFNVSYKRFLDTGIGRLIVGGQLGRLQRYPTAWENITFDLRAWQAAAAANPEVEITWQDTLFNFVIDLALNDHAEGPTDHPEFVEVDWIQLTGAEELLLGELQPQEVVVEAGLSNALFTAPDFFPVGEEVGVSSPGETNGILGDIDGDGDGDLVVTWTGEIATGGLPGSHWGWTVAFNDGLGGFVSTREVQVGPTDGLPRVRGGDFDGDGLLDLAVQDNDLLELWHNRGKDGFEPMLQQSDVYLLGLVDGDGDGDADLLIQENDDPWSKVTVWFNDGDDGFVRRDRFTLDSEEDFFPLVLSGQPLGEAVRLLWYRAGYASLESWQLTLTLPWAASEEPPLFLEAEIHPADLHLLTDFNGDGEVELIGAVDRNLQFDPAVASISRHGLALWRVDASGGVERHTLLNPQAILPHRAIASDLNGDGLQDLAVVDGNLATGPALVVLVGQRDGIPVVEGRYRLPGMGSEVLAGDLNGDGATDLVVLGRSIEGGPGGAFVFLNQGVPATAIAAETAATPAAFALGANYPNPFNPATTIPLVVPAGAKDVDLTIYNVLGQPMQRIWTGPLPAGEHRLTWDGRDGQGQSVAAGVYLYRLQVGEQARIRKMVKIE